MAETTQVAARAAKAPIGADIERASEFAREPFLLEGEKPKDLAPGTARRMALDDALAEIDAGREAPSMEWRSNYSLMLGLERVLAEDVPKLKDGAELNPHQVDALSGTLAALITELEGDSSKPAPNGNGEGEEPERVTSSNGSASRARPKPKPEPEPVAEEDDEEEDEQDDDELDLELEEDDEEEDEEELEEDDDELAPDEEPMDWEDAGEDEELAGEEVLTDPGADRRFWFEHATGAGKTVAAVGFIEASRTGGILILTHRRNLVDQFIGEISDRGYADRLSPPLLGDSDHPYGPVTVETYQWFVRNAGKVSDAYSIVICDEAHTALGEKTSACIRTWTGPVFIGMTATGALIARHVADLFPTQTSRFDLAQAARRGVIAPLRCIRIPPGPGVRTIANVPLRKGEVDQDFDQDELAKLLDQAPFNVAIADLYKSRFRKVPGVIYTAGVKHANNVAAAFQSAGINARAVSGETPKRELAETLAGFERGEVDVLCNAMLLAEGWNSPRATICMHLAPTASKRIYQQRVGRVTRRNPGKEAGLVIDFVHPATTNDDNVVTLHSLLDRDVYRGGAIVVGPVRRGRGRRVRVEKRVVPVSGESTRRLEVLERELWRIAVENLDHPEQHVWAALAGARVNPSGWRRAKAMLQHDATKELRRRFLLTCVQRNRNSALRLKALAEIATLRDPEAFDDAIDTVGTWTPRRPPRRNPRDARGARRAPHRPPRPGPGLGLAPRRLHARPPRGVRGAALARDQAPARPARQLFRPRPRAQRPPPRPRSPKPGSPPLRCGAGGGRLAHSRGRGGAARRPHARRPQALRSRSRAASKLPQVRLAQAQAQAKERRRWERRQRQPVRPLGPFRRSAQRRPGRGIEERFGQAGREASIEEATCREAGRPALAPSSAPIDGARGAPRPRRARGSCRHRVRPTGAPTRRCPTPSPRRRPTRSCAPRGRRAA